jgi:hypothetical protein
MNPEGSLPYSQAPATLKRKNVWKLKLKQTLFNKCWFNFYKINAQGKSRFLISFVSKA